jgi:acyl phosphate:glycerol-3-phosphate acyltransferase
MIIVLLVPLAFLLGTFPSAQLVARAHGRNVMQEGSGNPGASNVARLAGWRAGLLVLAADFAKGAIAAGVGLSVGGRVGAYVLGIAAVVGHTFPIYRKGGKGVAAAGGMLVVLYPWIVLVLLLTWGVLARVLRKASLATLPIVIAFPILVAVAGYDTWEIITVSAIAALLVLRHAANIRRLLHHEEIDLAASPDEQERRAS